jgi:hypothetical protein
MRRRKGSHEGRAAAAAKGYRPDLLLIGDQREWVEGSPAGAFLRLVASLSINNASGENSWKTYSASNFVAAVGHIFEPDWGNKCLWCLPRMK